jgi:hypothetical protein
MASLITQHQREQGLNESLFSELINRDCLSRGVTKADYEANVVA